MITYNTLEELQKDIVGNTLNIDDDIKINFDLDMPELLIKAKNIYAQDINAGDIYAQDIEAKNINALDICARHINALDIWARHINAIYINARNIYVCNIDAGDIKALGINAKNIFYSVCCYTWNYLICNSIESRHPKGKHWSIEGKVIINGEEQTQ
jgi:hypothetical protein